MIPKFRAWHKRLRIVCEVLDINLAHNEVVVLHNEDADTWFTNEFELMQWTGWNDNRQQNVYIGDVVQFDDEPPTLLIVKPNIGEIGFGFEILKQGGNYEDWYDHEEFGEGAICIIGNIYENPELLEQS